MGCRCAAFHGLPVAVPPRGTVRIALTFVTPVTPGPFRRRGVVESSAGSAAFEIAGHVGSP